jgi:hypothetical protein
MLHYRRRDSHTSLPPQMQAYTHPLLTYCNWSYDRASHIDIQTLRDILNHFDERYIHVYLRLINEIPRNIIESFVTAEHISPTAFSQIHHILTQRGFDLKDL